MYAVRRSLALVGLVAALTLTACGDDGEPMTTTVDVCDVRVPIYKVVRAIPEGMTGDVAFAEGRIAQDVISAEYRPNTAVLDPADIDGEPAVADLAENQVVVGPMFGVTVTVPDEGACVEL
jgi:hypothetical protein